MEDSKKIEELLHHFRMKAKDFAEKCGFEKTIISNIKAEKWGISKKLAEKIVIAFPEVNKNWLLNSEEPMILNNQKIESVQNSTIIGGMVKGNDNTIQHIVSTDKFAEISLGYQIIIKEQQRQINRLISIIEKNNEK